MALGLRIAERRSLMPLGADFSMSMLHGLVQRRPPLCWLGILTALQVQIYLAVVPLKDELILPTWAFHSSKLISLCRLQLLHASVYVLEPSRRAAALLWQGCSQWLVAQVASGGRNSG